MEKIVPIEETESEINQKVLAVGIGKGGLSSYTFIPDRRLAVVRGEYGSSTFGLVKNRWIVTFHLDASMKLSSVITKRYLAGL